MRHKFIIAFMAVCLAVLVAYQANEMTQKSISHLTLDNIAALANDENSNEKKGYDNDARECTIVEVYECHIGFTIPDWVPYIGGTECGWDYIDEVEFPGMINECRYTGNKEMSCDEYPCTKNGEL